MIKLFAYLCFAVVFFQALEWTRLIPPRQYLQEIPRFEFVPNGPPRNCPLPGTENMVAPENIGQAAQNFNQAADGSLKALYGAGRDLLGLAIKQFDASLSEVIQDKPMQKTYDEAQ